MDALPEGLARFHFGGGGDTFVTPLAFCIFLLSFGLILLLPRKYMIAPFFLASFLITVRQQIVVAGLHFPLYRLLILISCVRIIWSWSMSGGSRPPIRMDSLDKIFGLWALANAIT